jgi:hypothetical protein
MNTPSNGKEQHIDEDEYFGPDPDIKEQSLR